MQALTAERLVAEGVRDRARVDAEAAQAGRSALIGAVEKLTGVTVDHFAEVNLLGFYNLTRAIGGVDVCLKAAVDDPLSGARFPAGPRTVSGADALAFVRQRHGLPEGDLSRIRRQQVFLAAVADKILAGGTLTDPAKLNGLVEVAQQSVVLEAPTATTPEPPPLDVEAAHYVVHVRNGSGVEVEQDDAVPSGHLQVVLGADAPPLISGLPAPAPTTSSAPAASTAEQPSTAAGVPCVD